ncbi:MAG: Tetratricopeptide repeat-containing protein, partial [Candidatus Kentron sp. G]
TMSAIRHPCLIMGQCPSNFEGRNTIHEPYGCTFPPLYPGRMNNYASLDNLAALLQAQGKYGEARLLQEQTLEIHRSVFSEEHPDTAMSLGNLASLLRSQGQVDETLPLYKVISIKEHTSLLVLFAHSALQ